ncbi:MAG: hypothetical protein J6P66_10570 [Bacteroidaceae bacterium]|nr:hypothetical protein [Bacteroidaceae bacterium]
MKKIALVVSALVATVAPLHAEIETTVGADVVSRYIWRGMELGDAALQPSLGISAGGFSASLWGSTGIVRAADTKEFDITLSYSIAGLSAGVTDYWFSVGPEPAGRYFRYDDKATNHVFEAFVGYDFGFASVSWYTNLAGNDYDADGDNAFSSYCELAAPFSLGGLDWTATLGFVPMETAFYGTDGFAVTNIGLAAEKSLVITDKFSLPISAGVTFNPCSEMAYFVFGISF